MSRHTPYAAAFALALATLSAYAEPPSGCSQRKPPPEAYSACVGKSADDKVTPALRQHTMEATCEKIGDPPAARPPEPQ